MPILNYTSKIDPTKTIGEIQQCLARHGVRKIITDYDTENNAISVTFHLDMQGQPVAFALPCNWQGVLAVMKKDPAIGPKYCNEAQALRTGWRIVKDWIEAQLALTEAGLATLPEVMLPYVVLKSGETLYKHVQGNTQLLLT